MATKTTNFFSAILVVSAIVIMAMYADAELIKETNMTVYFHDYSSQRDPNATALLLVGFPGKVWSFFDFGTVGVFDDLLTQGPELTSPKLGRGQGLSISISLDGINAYASFSLVFTNGAYNGSTLQVLGNGNQLTVGEYGVVSGTGKFRYATGYLTLEPYSFHAATSYTILRANVTVRHY